MQDLSPKFELLTSEQEIETPETFQDQPAQMVGGFKATPSELSQGKVFIQGTAQRILIGDATAPLAGIGIFMGSDGDPTIGYDFRVGDPSGAYIHWDASTSTFTVRGVQTVSDFFTNGPTAITSGQAVYLYEGQRDGGITPDVTTGGDSATLSVTVANQSNRVMLIFVQNDTGDNVTAAAYNGDAATFIRKVNYTGNIWIYSYYLVAPDVGTANVSITSSSGNIKTQALVFYNCAQTAQPDSSAQATGTSDDPSSAVTIVNKGARSVMYVSNGTTVSSDGNTDTYVGMAESTFANLTPSPHTHGGVSSIITTVGAYTQSLHYTSAVTPPWGVIQVALKPANSYEGLVGPADASAAGTADSFIGFAAANISASTTDTAVTGEIIIAGVVTTLTSLTTGSRYYLSDTTGAISSSAGTVTRKAGIALSPTSLLLTNLW